MSHKNTIMKIFKTHVKIAFVLSCMALSTFLAAYSFKLFDPYEYSTRTKTLLLVDEGPSIIRFFCPIPLEPTTIKNDIDYSLYDTIIFWGHGNRYGSCGLSFTSVQDKTIELYSCNAGKPDSSLDIVKGNTTGYIITLPISLVLPYINKESSKAVIIIIFNWSCDVL